MATAIRCFCDKVIRHQPLIIQSAIINKHFVFGRVCSAHCVPIAHCRGMPNMESLCLPERAIFPFSMME